MPKLPFLKNSKLGSGASTHYVEEIPEHRFKKNQTGTLTIPVSKRDNSNKKNKETNVKTSMDSKKESKLKTDFGTKSKQNPEKRKTSKKRNKGIKVTPKNIVEMQTVGTNIQS